MYGCKIYRFKNSNEYGYHYKGNYGAKGEKRAPRKKATPEQVARQNQRNRVNKIRRLIKLNFSTRDYWCTLKYPKGERPSVKTVKKDFGAFIRRMRQKYSKLKEELKYIYRMEIGRLGGVHIHILINRIENAQTDMLVKESWKPSEGGSVNYQLLYEQGGFEELAEYIVKKPDEEQNKQLSFFDEEEQKQFCKYNRSRNLKEPVPEKKEYTRRTMRKIIDQGPAPTPGYYIDKNSIRCGVNPYTGMSYLYYTENRIKEGG